MQIVMKMEIVHYEMKLNLLIVPVMRDTEETGRFVQVLFIHLSNFFILCYIYTRYIKFDPF